MTQTCRGFDGGFGLKLFLKIMIACSARTTQLDVNKPIKRTETALKLILSLTFDREVRCMKYSAVSSAKLDKVINIFSLHLKII